MRNNRKHSALPSVVRATADRTPHRPHTVETPQELNGTIAMRNQRQLFIPDPGHRLKIPSVLPQGFTPQGEAHICAEPRVPYDIVWAKPHFSTTGRIICWGNASEVNPRRIASGILRLTPRIRSVPDTSGPWGMDVSLRRRVR